MNSLKICLDLIPKKITTSTKMHGMPKKITVSTKVHGTLKILPMHPPAEHIAQRIVQSVPMNQVPALKLPCIGVLRLS